MLCDWLLFVFLCGVVVCIVGGYCVDVGVG